MSTTLADFELDLRRNGKDGATTWDAAEEDDDTVKCTSTAPGLRVSPAPPSKPPLPPIQKDYKRDLKVGTRDCSVCPAQANVKTDDGEEIQETNTGDPQDVSKHARLATLGHCSPVEQRRKRKFCDC
ncbi:Hypothetical predicted protein [Lecanosticta acicola]|uniref:Uncharacterized protein n=1 Tax=Lecanosticta acicola TaxID=111012 RepID=A0AAI9ECV7_9PEZI|nr:Hypothetical predicted protein [Lecanosticta acicola]